MTEENQKGKKWYQSKYALGAIIGGALGIATGGLGAAIFLGALGAATPVAYNAGKEVAYGTHRILKETGAYPALGKLALEAYCKRKGYDPSSFLGKEEQEDIREEEDKEEPLESLINETLNRQKRYSEYDKAIRNVAYNRNSEPPIIDTYKANIVSSDTPHTYTRSPIFPDIQPPADGKSKYNLVRKTKTNNKQKADYDFSRIPNNANLESFKFSA